MTTATVKRAYKYRFYPTPQQHHDLMRTFGCVRVVWNEVLQRRTQRYRTQGASTSYADSDRMLTALKAEPEFSWLSQVSSVPLQQTLRHQHKAMTGFFEKRTAYPRLKTRRRSKASATYSVRGFRWDGQHLILAKMDQPLDIVWSRPLPDGAQPSTVTVSRDRADRWFVSFLVETTVQSLPATDKAVGVDLGVKTWAVTSDGEQIARPDNLVRAHAKVARAARAYSRTSKGSHRREKARARLARAHARVGDIRTDFLHQTSTRIIRENQTVVLEDLAVQAMTRSARGTVESPGTRVAAKAGLNRGILDGAWGSFRSMIEYKAAWYGRTVVIADRFYPSSKTCSACGFLLDSLPLSVRTWTCPSCRTRHDRDHNAAMNLRDFALGQGEKRNARGGPVRPLDLVSGGTACEPRIPVREGGEYVNREMPKEPQQGSSSDVTASDSGSDD